MQASCCCKQKLLHTLQSKFAQCQQPGTNHGKIARQREVFKILQGSVA